MAFLDEFIASFNKFGGPAHLNRFEIQIISPSAVFPGSEEDRHSSYKIKSLTMPGRNIRTATNTNVYGPTFEMAQGLTYAETVKMAFYLSSTHKEREYFTKWMDFIYKPDTYNLEYYDNYKASISIFQLDKSNKRVAGIKLEEAYPKTIDAIEYSQDTGDVALISVDFAFKELYSINSSGTPINPANKPRSSTVGLRTPINNLNPQDIARNIGNRIAADAVRNVRSQFGF